MNTTIKKTNKIIEDVYYGDVVWVDLGKPCGSVQGGKRPAMIISNNKNNKYSPKVNVVPFSSSTNKIKNKSYLPIHISVSPDMEGVTGITQESVILCEDVRALDKSQIMYKTGHIDNTYIITSLNKGLAIQQNR